jgi:hypothetical protein
MKKPLRRSPGINAVIGILDPLRSFPRTALSARTAPALQSDYPVCSEFAA